MSVVIKVLKLYTKIGGFFNVVVDVSRQIFKTVQIVGVDVVAF